MSIIVREISQEDYESLISFWSNINGLEIDESETKGSFEIFLERNKSMSFLALDGEKVVGSSLASHNGRRRFLNHLAVEPTHRGRGLAKELVEKCLQNASRAWYRQNLCVPI